MSLSMHPSNIEMSSRNLHPTYYHLKLPVVYKLPLLPGFKTSAAFLTSLSANLRLPDDDFLSSTATGIPFHPFGALAHDVAYISPSLLSSTTLPSSPSSLSSGTLSSASSVSGDNHPPRRRRRAGSAGSGHGSRRNSHGSLNVIWHTLKKSSSSPAGLSFLQTPLNPTRIASSSYPPVSPPHIPTSSTTTDAALSLLGSTILSQRAAATRILLLHPLNITIFSLPLFLALHILHYVGSTASTLFSTFLLSIAAAVATAWLMTRGYSTAATSFRSSADAWLGDDALFVSTNHWGQVVGAAVVCWVSDTPASRPGSSHGHAHSWSSASNGSSSGKGTGGGKRRRKVGRGEIRAWAVAEEWRGRGVGRGLLAGVAEWVEGKGGVRVEFAEEHFASQRVLPQYYDTPFERRDQRAYTALQHVLDDGGYFVKRRSFGR
ncbi:hypothetical protein P152DRAFT_478203 [Eremomyces bilateralis CBS 781.70]|uniref:N-acetyltransferase domain-containing protein n=1 Tax=Eremomyces bilateralis CBS 781.70 TaxID=1392243 RepID=A0A6G1GH32_9PEZI|nr:uncharacterized protein P152DRAFT_478203 [Eremomyces bilateralis CBS 781.70]KAF1817179.1 hypothetical protein P152DRAFT_478203 [Eremomyces bilateralis CBS 781.70]